MDKKTFTLMVILLVCLFVLALITIIIYRPAVTAQFKPLLEEKIDVVHS